MNLMGGCSGSLPFFKRNGSSSLDNHTHVSSDIRYLSPDSHQGPSSDTEGGDYFRLRYNQVFNPRILDHCHSAISLFTPPQADLHLLNHLDTLNRTIERDWVGFSL